jgi:hypothetical protein
MPMKTQMEWDIRDELAAMFMQATISGRYAEGRDPAVEAKATARRAYDMAAEFLAVRAEIADEAASSREAGTPAEAEAEP